MFYDSSLWCSQQRVGYLYSKSWSYSKELKRSLVDIDLTLLAWDNEKKFMTSMLKDIDRECEYVDQRVIDLFNVLGCEGENVSNVLHETMVDNLQSLISLKTLKILAFKERYLTYLEAQKIKKIEADVEHLEHICMDIKKLLNLEQM